MKIYLIRHGQTDWNIQGRFQGSTDIPLNNVGLNEAMQCAKYMKHLQIGHIYTSPLMRAKKTAEIIAAESNTTLTILEHLKEKSFGDAEGLTLEERLEKYPTRPFPNEEPFETFVTRCIGALYAIANENAAETIAIVAHGGVINALLHTLSNGEMGTNKTMLQNVSITTLTFENNEFNICQVNDTSYLVQA